MEISRYSGPGSQLVRADWKVDFNVHMATGLGFVVLEVDGAGAAGRGMAILNAVKRALGRLEVADQIAGINYALDEFAFLDRNRVGVSGVSYGGYVSAMILTDRDAGDLVKCGVAVSPVVDWRFYGEMFFSCVLFFSADMSASLLN